MKELLVTNKLGLHARPAAMFVRVANRYTSEILVETNGEESNGKSIMGLMLLAAKCGSRLKLTITGEDAAEMLGEIEHLLMHKLNSEE